MNPYYRDYADFLAEKFDGKVQKLPVDGGFSCPNRDGTLGYGGCVYCNNRSFSPMQSAGKTIRQQLGEGKRFFSRKYPSMKYLAYFQSHTNTYSPVDRALELYREAIETDDVVGLVIATRPDCMPDRLLDELTAINRLTPVIIEYGAESSHDTTLHRINRCHLWQDTVDAVRRTAAAGLSVGLHLIMGLPGENEEMMLTTVDRVSELPVDTIKFHQLQVISGTRLAADIAAGRESVEAMTLERYIDLCCKIIERLRDDIAIERFVSQSPGDMLISPRWGLKSGEFVKRLHRRLSQRNSRRM